MMRNVMRRRPNCLILGHLKPVRHFSTNGGIQGGEEKEQPQPSPLQDSSSHSSVVDRILDSPNQGCTFGKLLGVGKYTLKTDVINLLQASSDISPHDIKVDYNRMFNPLHMIVKFPSQSAFDSALRLIRGNRLYRLDMVDPTMWNIQSFEGKTVLLQGLPRNAIPEDIERFLSGCDFNSSNLQIFLRQGNPDPIKLALVQFPSPTEAMNAVLRKNRSFCLNNQVSMRALL